jgi:hypothetical protein
VFRRIADRWGNGGVRLEGDYRKLTGMTASEAETLLFLAQGPPPNRSQESKNRPMMAILGNGYSRWANVSHAQF